MTVQRRPDELIRILRAEFVTKAGGVPGSEATYSEWDKIIRIAADGSGTWIYEPDTAGLTAALAASTAGDMLWMPPARIAGNFTVPASVTMSSMGNDCIIEGTITLAGSSSHIIGMVVDYTAASAGQLVGVITSNAAGTSYINNCGFTVENTGAGDTLGIKHTGMGELYIWNSNVYGNASGGGDGYGISPEGGAVYMEGGWLRGSTLPASL